MPSTYYFRPRECFQQLVILFALFALLFPNQYKAQSPGSSTSPARSLNALLQDYAYQSLVPPRTGVPYDGTVPANLTGIKIAALRLRSGSLRRKGVPSYKEFRIPEGIIVQPYLERIVLVYQNLGSWSSFYYLLPGYTYLTPVLGLLAYDAANLSATNLPELDLVTTNLPILINFTNVLPVPSDTAVKCVRLGSNGSLDLGEMQSSNVCLTFRLGHYSIVVNSSIFPSPAPSEAPGLAPSSTGSKSNKSNIWKIVSAVVGGLVGLTLFTLLLFWLLYYKLKRNLEMMEQQADTEVSLHTARIGNAHVPVASWTRTQPVLENELVA